MLELNACVGNLGAYNEGHLIGEWVTFPVGEDESVELLKRIGVANENGEICGSYFIVCYDCEFGAEELIGKYASIDYLNDVAYFIDEWDEISFLAACEYAIEVGESMRDLLSTKPDSWVVISGINNEQALGEFYLKGDLIPDYLMDYFDCERYGKDINFEYDGEFTSYGWVYRLY